MLSIIDYSLRIRIPLFYTKSRVQKTIIGSALDIKNLFLLLLLCNKRSKLSTIQQIIGYIIHEHLYLNDFNGPLSKIYLNMRPLRQTTFTKLFYFKFSCNVKPIGIKEV